MAGRIPEENIARRWLEQEWRNVAFLHWRVDVSELAAHLAPHLPAELTPEVIDGSGWIGLTPFDVTRVDVPGSPTRSIVPAFPETNLRTYVRHRDGRDGLWFFSIDASSITSVVGGRAIGVPYHMARGSIDHDGAGVGRRIRYRMRRRGGPDVHHDITVVPGDPLEPDQLVDQLTGRWRAFTRLGLGGRRVTVEVPVEHQPWPLHRADLVSLDENLVTAAGLARPSADCMVHWSEGVTARFGRPHVLRT